MDRETGEPRSRGRRAQHRCPADRQAQGPHRPGQPGPDPGRRQAAPGRRPAGARRRPGPRPCRPPTRVPELRHRLPGEGLSPACDRDAVRPGHGPVAPLPLRRLRDDRGRHGMAAARPLDPGAGSAGSAALRPADVPDGGRGAGADVPGRRRDGSRDLAPSHLRGRRGATSAGDRRAGHSGRDDHGDLRFDLHPELRAGRAAPGSQDRQCRDDDGTPAGVRRRGEDRHGSRGLDPRQPRRCRTHRGDGIERLHGRLSRAAARPPRRRHRGTSDFRLVPPRHAAAAPWTSPRGVEG